jgi:hypothetical protein
LRPLTAKRKQAALIKQGMKKDAEKDRLTMIQVMLICLERDTRRSKVSFYMFSNCSVVACVSFVFIELSSHPLIQLWPAFFILLFRKKEE